MDAVAVNGSRRQPTDEVQLKKILEWELSLDARDLRSHAWYHGAISRAKAEEIVGERDGDFLVRDCTSQPGNYVLSCRSKGQNLHFVINKIILQPDTVYESVQYRFEDDGFDTVPDLITYYVGSGKPITVTSAAKIQNPRNRRHPLSFFDHKYDAQRGETRSQAAWATATATATAVARKQRSYSLRAGGDGNDTLPIPCRINETSTNELRRDSNSNSQLNRSFSFSLPRPSCWTKTRSCCIESLDAKLKTISADRDADIPKSRCSPQRCKCADDYANVDDGHGHGHGHDASTGPPPKPARHAIRRDSRSTRHYEMPPTTSSVAAAAAATTTAVTPYARKRCSLYATWSSDSGNGSDDSVRSCSAVVADGKSSPTTVFAIQRRMAGVVIKNPKYSDDGNGDGDGDGDQGHDRNVAHEATVASLLSRRDKDSDGGGDDDDDDGGDGVADESKKWCGDLIRASVARQTFASASAFDLEAFHTLLLPMVENKPLDTCALQGLHMLLIDSGSRILANHLTRTDLELTVNDMGHIRQPSGSRASVMCGSGIELSLLPQGRRHRWDLIERSECLRLLVAVTILTCATELERAELLNKWIEVAIDTKTALGNLFGFCAIMLGLCTPQVQRLNETWHILRQRYTDSAFNFEAKLRPTLKCMNESTNPLAPNTTIPHLLPVILLYERYHPYNLDLGCDGGGGENDDDHDHGVDEDVCHVLTQNSHISNICIDQWEACTPDLGLGTLYSHLNATRQFYSSLPTFRRNAEIVLADTKTDDLLSDMFRTEFHLKFLWGSRGAKVNAAERYSKFQQVLNVMSQKCETIDYGDDDGYDDANANADTGASIDRLINSKYHHGDSATIV